MIGSDIDETIQGLFYSLLERHGRQDLEESIKVAIDGLHYKCHNISHRCGGSYKYSPQWIKDKKAKIN